MHLSFLPIVFDLANLLNDLRLLVPAALTGAMKGFNKSTIFSISDGLKKPPELISGGGQLVVVIID